MTLIMYPPCDPNATYNFMAISTLIYMYSTSTAVMNISKILLSSNTFFSERIQKRLKCSQILYKSNKRLLNEITNIHFLSLKLFKRQKMDKCMFLKIECIYKHNAMVIDIHHAKNQCVSLCSFWYINSEVCFSLSLKWLKRAKIRQLGRFAKC